MTLSLRSFPALSEPGALSGPEALRLVQAVPGVLLLVRGGALAYRHVSVCCQSPRLTAWVGTLDELPRPLLDLATATRRARSMVSELDLEEDFVVRVDAVSLNDEEVALHVLDVTEQRRVEHQVLTAERARLTAQQFSHRVASERLSALSTVAAGVGHEINNPLTWLTSSLEFARRELAAGSVSAEVLEALGEAEQGVARIAAVVRDLRVLSSRPETGRVETIGVLPAIRAALQATAGTFRGRVPVVLHAEHALEARAHEANLVQVLVNLLANAAQSLEPVASEEGRVDVRLLGPVDEHVLIEVRDTGCGIDETTMARAFDPFFTTRPVNGGAGLGLAICRVLVEAMGGHLELESAPGRGTTARLRLVSAAPRERGGSDGPPLLRDPGE
jgi:C4-dicarboxylate-specific signal transduction histidine kinase